MYRSTDSGHCFTMNTVAYRQLLCTFLMIFIGSSSLVPCVVRIPPRGTGTHMTHDKKAIEVVVRYIHALTAREHN